MISVFKIFEAVAPPNIEAVPPTPVSPETATQPIQQTLSLVEVFPDLPETADPCVLAEFFISKCDDVARGVPTEPKITQVPEPSEPGGRASVPVEITPKGVMPTR